MSCSPSVEAVIAAVAGRRDPAILDSVQAGGEHGRFTIVGCDPALVISYPLDGDDPLDGMRGHLRATGFLQSSAEPLPPHIPLPAGWIGYFAYESGRYIERLPATTAQDIGLPVARFALYDSLAVLDNLTGLWTITAADLPGVTGLATMENRIAAWTARLEQAPSPPPPLAIPQSVTEHNMSRQQYLRMISRARDYIAAGDIFQVNLARRETLAAWEPSWQTYLRLRRTNPAAYAAFLSWREPGCDDAGTENAEAAILCSSPELFLRVRDRDVLTRPIKGTRPRSADPVADDEARLELAISEKDRAELAMIVDLERNDLGRVCEYGSIRVAIDRESAALPYSLETHPTVHHLVASVTGRLADGRDVIDLLRAAFPGGSITGAPKVRAMEIIDELEPSERSVYTGAIGWFGPDGSMTMNIAIRTIIRARSRLHLYAGGGIVADSVAEAEYEETRAKALGMSRALGLVLPEEPESVEPSAVIGPTSRSPS